MANKPPASIQIRTVVLQRLTNYCCWHSSSLARLVEAMENWFQQHLEVRKCLSSDLYCFSGFTEGKWHHKLSTPTVVLHLAKDIRLSLHPSQPIWQAIHRIKEATLGKWEAKSFSEQLGLYLTLWSLRHAFSFLLLDPLQFSRLCFKSEWLLLGNLLASSTFNSLWPCEQHHADWNSSWHKRDKGYSVNTHPDEFSVTTKPSRDKRAFLFSTYCNNQKICNCLFLGRTAVSRYAYFTPTTWEG